MAGPGLAAVGVGELIGNSVRTQPMIQAHCMITYYAMVLPPEGTLSRTARTNDIVGDGCVCRVVWRWIRLVVLKR